MEHKPLRDGFTTGTCAAAAAKAAAVLLRGQGASAEAAELSPVLTKLETPAGITANLEAQVLYVSSNRAACQVKKDAGDDPDVTDQSWIQAEVELVDRERWERESELGCGYQLDEYPHFYLTGGPGVGIATKPGLSCPPGSYAINPVPRQMIIQAVADVFDGKSRELFCCIRISVPEGAGLAVKTFNPKLGITGGISIIGTTGIVKPMSEDALRDTIKLELHMKTLERQEPVFVVPGNYGETFLREQLGIRTGAAVTCSNFIAEMVEYAAAEGIRRLLLAGHIGKLIKVAGGVRNTHSQFGDRRMELLSGFVRSYDEGAAKLTVSANTTDEAVGILMQYGLAELVLDDVAAAVKTQMQAWGGGVVEVEVVTFSSAYGILGETSRVRPWLEEWRQRKDWV